MVYVRLAHYALHPSIYNQEQPIISSNENNAESSPIIYTVNS
mgnify:CR=1 FL=1